MVMEEQMEHSIRILQITDLHLFGDKQKTLVGINPYRSLQKVLNEVKLDIQTRKPDLIVFTGDISQDFSEASYEIAAQIFAELSCPFIITLGNHDREEMAKHLFPDFDAIAQKSPHIGNWHIITLNSHWLDHVNGLLTEKELTFLEKELNAANNEPTMIFLHHQAWETQCLWINRIGVSNRDAFMKIIENHTNIKAVICGHIHHETFMHLNGIDFRSTPSTCWQFTPETNEFKLDRAMPGYRTLDLFANGTYATKIIRVNFDQELVPDLKSTGY